MLSRVHNGPKLIALAKADRVQNLLRQVAAAQDVDLPLLLEEACAQPGRGTQRVGRAGHGGNVRAVVEYVSGRNVGKQRPCAHELPGELRKHALSRGRLWGG